MMKRNFWKNEQGDTNLVSMVFWIAVIIILVMLFRLEITSFIEGLISKL